MRTCRWLVCPFHFLSSRGAQKECGGPSTAHPCPCEQLYVKQSLFILSPWPGHTIIMHEHRFVVENAHAWWVRVDLLLLRSPCRQYHHTLKTTGKEGGVCMGEGEGGKE